MKFTLRLVSALWLSVMLVIGVFAYLQIREERERLVGDLQRRAILISEGLSDAIEAAAAKQSPAAIERIVKKFGQSQRGIAVYDRFANQRFATADVAPILPPSLPEVTEAISKNSATQGYRTLGGRSRFIYATPLIADSCMRTARARRPGVSAFPSIAAALAIPSNQERRSVLAGVPVLPSRVVGKRTSTHHRPARRSRLMLTGSNKSEEIRHGRGWTVHRLGSCRPGPREEGHRGARGRSGILGARAGGRPDREF